MPYDDEDDYESYHEEDEDESDNDSNLLPHDWSPPIMHYVKSDGEKTTLPGRNLWLGFEIEVRSLPGDRRSDVEVLKNFSDLIYMKYDGSLNEQDGFEIVSLPMSAQFLRSFVPKLSAKMEGLMLKGHSAGEGYGMHIHVSRRALSQLHQAKLIFFMSDINRELLVTVAQREDAEWCEIKNKRMRARELFEDLDKYQALNILHEKTLEYRIFRSNTQAHRILKNIEFVLATIEYTRNCGLNDLETEPFLKWLKANRKEYMNLYKFLAEKEEGNNYTGRYANVLNCSRAKRAANA